MDQTHQTVKDSDRRPSQVSRHLGNSQAQDCPATAAFVKVLEFEWRSPGRKADWQTARLGSYSAAQAAGFSGAHLQH